MRYKTRLIFKLLRIRVGRVGNLLVIRTIRYNFFVVYRVVSKYAASMVMGSNIKNIHITILVYYKI